MALNARTVIADFIAKESAGGLALCAAAALALIAINSPLAPLYSDLWRTPVEVRVGALEIAKPLLLWVNDGLMAVFFFLIGLEVKREVIAGELSSLDKATLPIAAATGGMAVPAAVFVAINWNTPQNLDGWAIPAATDIAFALGVLALLGKRVPPALKVLLLAIAIIDDVAAIVIIAFFYTAALSTTALALAAAAAALLFVINRAGVERTSAYVLVGIFLWVCVLKSGVHATLAGVVTALAVPLYGQSGQSPLQKVEHRLHPWIAFLVLPVFAFANAGVSLSGIDVATLLAPLPLGIALGLFVGKQVGVLGFMALASATGIGKRPASASWTQLYGLACLTGIGFTMSLFIGTLAFEDLARVEALKLGVLAGSLASGLVGVLVLILAHRAPHSALGSNST